MNLEASARAGRRTPVVMDTGLAGGIAVVVFGWGALRLGVAATAVAGLESATDADLDSIGDLLGLAAPDAKILAGRVPLRVLRLALPSGPRRVRVEGPVERWCLPVAAIHPLPVLLAARLRLPGVRALAYPEPDGTPSLTILLDANALPS